MRMSAFAGGAVGAWFGIGIGAAGPVLLNMTSPMLRYEDIVFDIYAVLFTSATGGVVGAIVGAIATPVIMNSLYGLYRRCIVV